MRAKQSILIPSNGADLIARELSLAFIALGFETLNPRPNELEARLPEIIARKPALVLSINFQGLTGRGIKTLRALQEAGISTAIWCVDNPWHLLSAVQGPDWKKSTLFLTDYSFAPALKRHGAEKVAPLPLAASPAVMAEGVTAAGGVHTGSIVEGLLPVVFVGRPSFPGRETFFAGQSPPREVLCKALKLVEQGGRPDFAWWLTELGLEEVALWPGKKARLAGAGAEECNLALRVAALRAAIPSGLTIFGQDDAAPLNWRALLPYSPVAPPVPGVLQEIGSDLRPVVDYYAHTASIYRQAEFSLNMCSLLLPHGLTQRNFDVWLAGGFCLSAWTPALDLFPRELVQGVTFSLPEKIPEMVDYFRQRPKEKRELAAAWRKHILAGHTYEQRAREILRIMETCP